MAATPPAQIRGEARTPPTPLHGSAYHSTTPSRYNTRSSIRKSPDSGQSSFTQSPRSTRTLRSPKPPALNLHSPQSTPKRTSRRTHALSPTSDTEPLAPQPKNPSYLSATTILEEGMLPTPVKTPQKKTVPKSTMAARALFQDAHPTHSAVFESPRKQKNKKRHNGFSLESFSADTDPVHIHVDSRDQVPEVDTSSDNPFYAPPAQPSKKGTLPTKSAAQKVPGTPKRRKVSTEAEKKPLDPQVEDALEKDEGMVYVFRGKKVYRRFDDAGDEEEVIDPEELGLLGDRADGAQIVRPLKTLTRKSIKPRKLFQPESEPPKVDTQDDEEADTEIEDDQNGREELPSPSRATRSKDKDLSTNGASASASASSKRKRTSPFESWKRIKPGSRSSGSVPASAGRKRTAGEALEV